MDVSILARPEGRALQRLICFVQLVIGVSILARPEGRALQGQRNARIKLLKFQSSPAPKDGRYDLGHFEEPAWPMFQSSPAPKDGRYRGDRARMIDADLFQSSPAPKDGRYME